MSQKSSSSGTNLMDTRQELGDLVKRRAEIAVRMLAYTYVI